MDGTEYVYSKFGHGTSCRQALEPAMNVVHVALVLPVHVERIYMTAPKNESLSYRSSYRFSSYPLKILLDADIGKVHTQRIRDRADNSD